MPEAKVRDCRMFHEFSVSLRIRTPFIFPATTGAFHSVDTAMLRNQNGALMLPGSQLRGVLRQILEEISLGGSDHLAPDVVAKWFGTRNGVDQRVTREEHWPMERSLVEFKDLVEQTEGEARLSGASSTAQQTRVSIDPETGAAIHGALQVIEQPDLPGKVFEFKGLVHVFAGLEECKLFVKWLKIALALVPSIGAYKSIGFGRVAGFDLGTPRQVTSTTFQSTDTGCGLDYWLEFNDPFLVNAQGWGGNVLSGATTIPGSVVKAVLAKSLPPDFPTDRISELVIQEARPVRNKDERRPQIAPLSIYSLNGYDIGDARRRTKPADWVGDTIAFCHDWKEMGHEVGSLAASYPNHNEFPRETRTRTAVGDNNVAETSQLFSYSAIVPNGMIWRGKIWFGNDHNFSDFAGKLPEQLFGIGKTNASAKITFSPCEKPEPPKEIDEIHIVLETPAWIPLASPNKEQSRSDALRSSYHSFFVDSLGFDKATFDEFDFYAAQARTGGFLSGRFRHDPDRYAPRHLTLAGSTFSFYGLQALPEKLMAAMTHGLPISNCLGSRAKSWKTNPFLPQNGFGEIHISSNPRIDLGG